MVKPAEIDDDATALLAREIAAGDRGPARLPGADQGHRDPREPRRRLSPSRRGRRGGAIATMRTYYLRSFGCQMNDARRRAHPRAARGRRPGARRTSPTTPTCSSTTRAPCGERRRALAGHLGTAAAAQARGRRPPRPRDSAACRRPSRTTSSGVSPSSTAPSARRTCIACRSCSPGQRSRCAAGTAAELLRRRPDPERRPPGAPRAALSGLGADHVGLHQLLLVLHRAAGARPRAQPRRAVAARRGARRSSPTASARSPFSARTSTPTASICDGEGARERRTSPALLRALDAVPGLDRLRFMTSHPKDLSDDLIGRSPSCPASASTCTCRPSRVRTASWPPWLGLHRGRLPRARARRCVRPCLT